MVARLSIDVASRRILAAEGAMDLLAFYPSPVTRGESCRDSLPNFADLVGASIDATLVASIRAAIGRERGCYHLTSLVLAAVPVILSAVEEPEPRSEPRSRIVEISAASAGERRVRFHALLYDRRAPRDLRRARLAFTVGADEMILHDVDAQAAPSLASHRAAAAALADLPLLAGFARGALERLRTLPGTTDPTWRWRSAPSRHRPSCTCPSRASSRPPVKQTALSRPAGCGGSADHSNRCRPAGSAPTTDRFPSAPTATSADSKFAIGRGSVGLGWMLRAAGQRALVAT
jgi:hypothetical protein